MGKYDHIRDVYRWKGIDKEIENKLIDERKTLITKQATLTETKISLVSKFKKAKDSDKNDLKNKISNINTKLKDIEARLSVLTEDFEGVLEEELMFNGRTLFSFLFPDDFEYTFQNNMDINNKPVHITRGVMLSGTLNKAIIGSAAGSVSHIIRLNYSARRAIEFVSYYQMIINRWLLTRGFSVGIEDCIPNHSVDKKPCRLNLTLKPNHLLDYKKDNIIMQMKNKTVVSDKPLEKQEQESNFIKTETTKCFSKALLYMQTEDDDDLKELKVNNALNNARDIGQRIAKESLSPYNSFVAMIRSGAKGNDNNITQITSMLGQQNAEGKRMPLVFGHRSLPHFQKKLDEYVISKEATSAKMLEDLFGSRGFVHSGFYKGLTPYEFFFHTVGGREGLIDTACKTADTGYIQRKMVKLLEDLQVTYRGTVEDSSKNIISFDYGGDNFDGAKVIYRGGDPLFMDVETICNRLNADYEWEQHKKKQTEASIQVISDQEEIEEDGHSILKNVEKKSITIKGGVEIDEDFNNATLGFSFENALCNVFNLEYNESNVNKDIVNKLTERLKKSMFGDLILTKYIGESKNEIDFEGTLRGKKVNISVKSSFSSDKIAPQELGQPSRNKFRDIFNLEDNKPETIKAFLEDKDNVIDFLSRCVDTFKKTQVLIYLKCSKTDESLKFSSVDVINLENMTIKKLEKSKISYTHQEKNGVWNESTTIKYNGKGIAEIQVHNNRNCVKTRFVGKYLF